MGPLIEPFAVQLMENGQFSYAFTRINSITINDYFKIDNLHPALFKAIKASDCYTRQYLTKRFSENNKKRTINFIKNIANHPQINHIRNFIERKTVQCIHYLNQCNEVVYYKGESKDAIKEKKIEICDSPATVIFNFTREDTGARYFLSIKQNNHELLLKGTDNLLLTNKPCWLYINDKLYTFEESFDSKKLIPFFKKDYVSIPKKAEEKYFETFVYNAIKKFHVRAKGFDIKDVKPGKHVLLSLEADWKNHPVLVFYVMYGNKKILVSKKEDNFLEFQKDNGYFIYKRIQRDFKWEQEKQKQLEALGLVLKDEANFTVKINENKTLSNSEMRNNLLSFINEKNEQLEKYDFKITQEFYKENYFTGHISLSIDVDEKIDWFDVHIIVKFGEFTFPFLQLKKHILNGIKEFTLPTGEIAIIPDPWFSRFDELLLFNKTLDNERPIEISKHHFQIINKLQSKKKKLQTLEQLNKFKRMPAPSIPTRLNAKLRPYQEKGYHWLYYLQKNELGGCLADDMGLGKTLQTLTILLKTKLESESFYTQQQSKNPSQLNLFEDDMLQKANNQSKTSLIIMPLSLIYNWEDEINKFAPLLQIYKHTGSNRKESAEQFKYYDIVLTTYGVVRNDIEFLKDFIFHYLILDESQIIKNPYSKIYKAVKLLHAEHKLVLTGTPIENSLTDLWSQMNFLNPGFLGSIDFFKDSFVTPIEKMADAKKEKMLGKLIEPFILRRTKKIVAKDLPALSEKIHYCEMTDEQEKLYEEKKSAIRNYIIKNISKYGRKKSRFIILKGLMQLRLVSNHPKLLNKNTEADSGKFNEVIRSIESLLAENHKVLVFSQFVKHLKLFEEYLNEKSIQYCKITGGMPEKQRKEMVTAFQKEANKKLFLISLKAGGVGLNLTAADYVFLLDPWWNPAVEYQAINRAHRIGQVKKVFAYKFITKNSIEEKIYQLQQKKSALAEKFIHTNNPIHYFSNEEIYQFFN